MRELSLLARIMMGIAITTSVEIVAKLGGLAMRNNAARVGDEHRKVENLGRNP